MGRSNETYMLVTPEGGSPADRYSADLWHKLPIGETVLVTWRKQRNLKFHRLFFAALNFVFKQQDMYSVLDDFRADITIALGHFTIETYRKEEVKRPKSISFAKMDDVAFREFFDGFVKLICERIAPNLSKEHFNRFLEILDGNSGAQGVRDVS